MGRTNELQQLNDWWRSELGKAIMVREREIIRDRFASVFGFHLMMLGVSIQMRLVEHSLVPNHTLINPYKSDFGQGIRGFWEMLPILSQSVDVVVAPHAFCVSKDPVESLKEIHRVLVPEGRLLIFGFNPHSFWRLKGLLTRRKVLPWSGKFYSRKFVRNELEQMGFEIVKQDYFYLQPPAKNTKTFERLNFLNKVGWLGLANFSGLYYIEAQKKVRGVKPLKAEAVAMNKVKLRQGVAGTARSL